MNYKEEYEITTHQSVLTFKRSTVEKVYLQDHNKNGLSSVKNEMHCLKKFSIENSYAPRIIRSGDHSYVMKRYDFSLGNTKRISEVNVRRMFFSCTLKEVLKQIDEIELILKKKKIIHKDINPGNLLFCEKEKKIKLIDFYWASTDGINEDFVKGINGIYKDDQTAFSKIKKQIKSVYNTVRNEIEISRNKLKKLGKPYYDGSAKHRGKTYHPIIIPHYKENQYHKSINYEFNNILTNIKNDIRSVLDVGCAAGYYLFSFIRKYSIERAIGFEADPNMLSFLKYVKKTFRLDEVSLNGGISYDTDIPKVDLVICMNVHMWLVKQFDKKADIIISNLIKNSKEMFFQTAGAESSGMYLVKNLKSKDDIQKYLEDLGGKRVSYIDSSKRGGKRYLFKIEES